MIRARGVLGANGVGREAEQVGVAGGGGLGPEVRGRARLVPDLPVADRKRRGARVLRRVVALRCPEGAVRPVALHRGADEGSARRGGRPRSRAAAPCWSRSRARRRCCRSIRASRRRNGSEAVPRAAASPTIRSMERQSQWFSGGSGSSSPRTGLYRPGPHGPGVAWISGHRRMKRTLDTSPLPMPLELEVANVLRVALGDDAIGDRRRVRRRRGGQPHGRQRACEQRNHGEPAPQRTPGMSVGIHGCAYNTQPVHRSQRKGRKR